MTQSDEHAPRTSIQDVALIIGGGPGISSSCARLFAANGMRVGIAARDPEKPVLQNLEKAHGVRRYGCDASDPAAMELLFQNVVRELGTPTLVVHRAQEASLAAVQRAVRGGAICLKVDGFVSL